MNWTCLIAIAAGLAGAGFGATALAQKTMYRCGNTYQDRPCDEGQKGSVVGTTGASSGSSRSDSSSAGARKAPDPKGTRVAPSVSREELDAAQEQFKRDFRPTHEANMKYYAEQCASGRQDYCVSLACERVVYDDTDANLIACVKARGWRLGNGWYTASGWEQTPSVPTSDWWLKFECTRKVGRERPRGEIRRKNGVPESAIDVEAEAAKVCRSS